MFERRIFVLAIARECQRTMERLFEIAGQHGMTLLSTMISDTHRTAGYRVIMHKTSRLAVCCTKPSGRRHSTARRWLARRAIVFDATVLQEVATAHQHS